MHQPPATSDRRGAGIPPRRVPMSCRLAWLLAVAAAAALVMPSLAPRAWAQTELTPEAVKSQVAERFGVEVLRVTEAEENGRPIFVVTVMNPAGDYNGAFQVNRLAVDRATGELVSQFRHEAAGYVLSGGAGGGGETDGRAIRRMTMPDSTRQ